MQTTHGTLDQCQLNSAENSETCNDGDYGDDEDDYDDLGTVRV